MTLLKSYIRLKESYISVTNNLGSLSDDQDSSLIGVAQAMNGYKKSPGNYKAFWRYV